MPLKHPFALPWPLTVGDRVPSWIMPSTTDKDCDAGDLVGRPAVLWFSPLDDLESVRRQATGFAEHADEFARLGANVAGVLPASVQTLKALTPLLGLSLFLLSDADGSVMVAHRAVHDAAGNGSRQLIPMRKTFVLDPSLRVLRIYEEDPQDHAGKALEFLRGFVQQEAPRHIAVQAPVLLVPNVFSPEYCREMIQVWETQGNQDSGFMVQRDGKTVGVMDYGHKIRRDHFLQEGEVKKRIMYTIYHRVKPEIQKAYNFEITRFEDFRIVCYESSRGGYFRPHRDNTTTGTAHRVWALTINLNVGEYEGGYLRFPEFGPHLYRPGTGDAVVFSCSLLHEATDITGGRRFALLSFLYGEREAKMRDELARQTPAQ